jgi:hypothetical protein
MTANEHTPACGHPSEEGIPILRTPGIESPLERGARRAGCVGANKDGS